MNQGDVRSLDPDQLVSGQASQPLGAMLAGDYKPIPIGEALHDEAHASVQTPVDVNHGDRDERVLPIPTL